MRCNKLICIMTIGVLNFVVICVQAKARGPAVDVVEVEFKANVGSKKNFFKIKKLGQSGQLEYRSSEVGNGEREISEKNLKYLLKVAKQISKEDSNDRSFCLRSHFKMKIKTTQEANIIKYGCIGSKTPVIEKMNNYANLMAMMI